MSPGESVIDSIALPNVDTKLPDSIAAKPVIAKVVQLDAVDSPVDGDPCARVAELPLPFHVDVFIALRQVMANLVHRRIIVYKRI